MKTTLKYVLPFLILTICVPFSMAQKVAYIRSEYILNKLPEYAQVQQKLDRMAQDWEAELKRKQQEVDDMFRDYQARELLYTPEARNAKRQDITTKEKSLEDLRRRYFGPEGELFKQQENLMKPLQERVLTAVETVSKRESYDLILDKNGQYVFVFTNEKYDLSNLVLKELGIDPKNMDTPRTGGF
jgi:outer membrane protein